MSRSTVQHVTTLEIQLPNNKETFRKFDVEINRILKSPQRGYAKAKPKPEDWANLFEEDPTSEEEFNHCLNDISIIKSDDYTPYVLNDTNVDKEIAIP